MFDPDSDYSFNWKAVLISLASLLVVGFSLFFAHRIQMGRLERYLLGQIETAKASGDQEQTIKSLNRFMVYQPDAPRQKAELTELMADPDAPKRAYEVLIPMLYQAIASCEQNPELEDKLPSLRGKLLDNLSRAMRSGEAIEQIAKLATEQIDPDLDKKLALTRYRHSVVAGEDPSIGRILTGTATWVENRCKLDPVDHLQEALRNLKGDVELTAMLGNACILEPTKLVRSDLAKFDTQELASFIKLKLLEMIQKNEASPDAWLINYQILSRIAPEQAGEDIEKALVKFPEDPAILQQAAVHKMARLLEAKRAGSIDSLKTQIEQAEEILGKIKVGVGLRTPFTYSSLSELALAKNQKDKAIEMLEDGIRVCEPPLIDLQLRIAQIYNRSNEPEKAIEALKRADDTLRQDAPRLNPAQQVEYSRAVKQQWLEYYNGQGNLVAVNEQLESLLVSTASSDMNTELRIQAFAAEAFRKIGYWDKATNAYLRALALAPRNESLRRGAAESLVKSNRTADAIKQFELIQDKQPGDWMQIALLRLLGQNLQLSVEEFDIKAIETALNRARESAETNQLDNSYTNLLDVLQADFDVRKTNPSKRQEKIAEWTPRIVAMCHAQPNQELLLKNAVNLLSTWGEIESARSIRQVLWDQNPGGLDFHLEQATQMANSGQVGQAIDYLMERLKDFPADVRLNQFIVGLLPIDEAFSGRVEKLLDATGSSFSVMSDLCEYLLRLPQYTGGFSEHEKAKSLPKVELWNSVMQSAELRLRKLEGEKGTAWRYTKARRLLIKSLFDERPDFSAVLELIQQIEEVRPEWAYLYVIRGALSEQLKEPSKAIKAYQTAVGLSVDDIRVFERLIELLYQEGKFEDAETYIARLGQVSNRSNRIASVALRLSERNQSNTLDIARLGTEARPLDPQAWIWYAKVIERTSRTMGPQDRQASVEQAERYLVRARQLAPDQCDSVRALFQHYALTGQTPELELLAQAVEADRVITPEPDRLSTLGNMFLYMNKLDRAEDCYNKAITAGGDAGRIGVLKAEAMVRGGKLSEAIEYLTELTKDKPEMREVRQSLAMLLANRSAPADWKQIDDVLTAPPFGNSLEDRLVHAKLLMTRRSYADLEKAREKLQGVSDVRTNSTSEVLFILGMINRYLLDLSNRDQINNTDTRNYQEAAGSALEQAASSTPPNENYISGYISFLIERNRIKDVETQLEKLMSVSPNSRSTAMVRAFWHQAKDQKELARQVVLDWFSQAAKVDYSPSVELNAISDETLTFANALFEVIEDKEGSDRTFDAILDHNPQIAKTYLNTLLRHDISLLRNAALRRTITSIDELNFTPIDTSVLLSIVSTLQFDQEKVDALVGILKKKLDEPQEIDMLVLVSMGDFLLSKRATPEALAVYKRIVAKEPKNPTALNNIANILIETSPDNSQEALGYIERAVAILPNNAVLLDTQGTVLIMLKRYEEAAQALSVATKAGGDPRSALHWYIALINAGKIQEAEKVKPMIDRKSLRDVYLLPEDKAALEKL
jgi:tetratricopeptide (TPR) repeat protein